MNKQTLSSKANRQQGLTLIELMIALTIGLFLVGAVGTLYVNTRGSFDYANEVARIQETGRFGLEAISRDIRMAGYNGCGTSIPTYNVVTGGLTNPLLNFATPIQGYKGSSASDYPAALSSATVEGVSRPVILGTDAITLLTVDSSSEMVVQGHNPTSAQIDTSTHSIQVGEILLVTDCAKASVFQVSGPTNTGNNASHVVHNTGNASPGNCQKALGGNCGNAVNYTYKPGSQMMRVVSNTYYIANASPSSQAAYPNRAQTLRSLYAMVLEGGANGTPSAKELLVGVENMQIIYNLDTTAGTTGLGVVNNPNQTVAGVAGAWNQVASVQITLTVSSSNDKISSSHQAIRKDFAETIVARNRTL